MSVEAAPFRTVPCRRFRSGRFAEITDTVAREVSLSVCMDGGSPRRLVASPMAPTELVLGHAALELATSGRVPTIRRAEGLCFELTSQPDPRAAADPALPHALPAADLVATMRRFIGAPGLWDTTGCFHRAALLDTVTGEFVAWAEDIGRHNCLDRLVGQCLTKGMRPAELSLFLSCRVTGSLMDKAARAGLRLIVSRSAVSDAAIEMAAQVGTTLVGFAREAEQRLTVFTDPEGRIGPCLPGPTCPWG